MPHKRTKSKRQTLKTKYTVEKKVRAMAEACVDRAASGMTGNASLAG